MQSNKREIDARGTYKPFGEVRVNKPSDLVFNGIYVHPEVVRRTWGDEAGDGYQNDMAKRFRRETPAPLQVPESPVTIQQMEMNDLQVRTDALRNVRAQLRKLTK